MNQVDKHMADNVNLLNFRSHIQPQFLRIIIFSVLAGVSITFFLGYRMGLGNHHEHLPLIYKAIDSSYLENDFFVKTQSSDFGPRYYYSHFIAGFSKILSIPIIFLLLTCLQNILITAVTFLFARRLLNNENSLAILASIFVVSFRGFTIAGAGGLNCSSLSPNYLVLFLAMLSLWMGLENRPFLVVVFSCPAVLIHPLVGFEAGAVALCIAGVAVALNLTKLRYNKRQKLLKIGCVIIAGLFLLLFLIVFWIIPAGKSGLSMPWLHYIIHYRAPHHYICSYFPLEDYIGVISFLVATGIMWKWYYDDLSTDRKTAKLLLVPIISVILACICGYVFVELIPIRLVIIAQPFRMIYIIKWIGLILLGRTFANLIFGKDSPGKTIVAAMLVLSFGIYQPMLMLICILIEIARRKLVTRLNAKVIRIILLMLFSLQVFLVSGTFNFAFIGIGVLLSVSVAGILVFAASRKHLKYAGISGFAGLLIFVVLLTITPLSLGTIKAWIPVEYKRVFKPIIRLSQLKAPRIDIAKFARQNTPNDALFITPPFFGGFRIVARRAIVVDMKMVGYSDMAVSEWKKRVEDIYGKTELIGFPAFFDEMEEAYKKITDDKLLDLANKYNASYAVLYLETSTNLLVLYSNDKYRIVKIK